MGSTLKDVAKLAGVSFTSEISGSGGRCVSLLREGQGIAVQCDRAFTLDVNGKRYDLPAGEHRIALPQETNF